MHKHPELLPWFFLRCLLKASRLLHQDSSLLDDMLEDGTSNDNTHLPICLQNTLDVGQGTVIFFDVKIWSKILSGNVFCNEYAMLKLA